MFETESLMDFFEEEPESPIGGDGRMIDYRAELNEDQYGAVTAPNGPALVLAGAGSGKTRTLTYRVAWLLEQGVQPWEILLLTFTNKAAKEMLERVEDLTGVSAVKFWGGTFHHIGQRIIRSHAEELGLSPNFNIMDASEAEGLLGDVVRDKDPGFFKNKDHPKARVIGEIISYARNTCQNVQQVIKDKYPYFSHLVEVIPGFFEEYKYRKLKQAVMDYDDLLEHWLRLLKDFPHLREIYQERFKSILVDEYQDTNKIQSAIVDRMAGNHQVMAVGDDAQCIYTWRGANFENIMTFGQRHPGAKIFKIETNYRSIPPVLNLANAVLSNQAPTQGYRKELKPVRSGGMKPYFVPAADPRHQAAFIVKRIQGLLSEGFRLGDIAILYRAHFHAMDLQMELSKASIPYQITSGVRFFEQAHVKDLISQLRFASNPQDGPAFSRFACLLPKVGAKTAERILKTAQELAEKEGKSVFQVLDDEVVKKKVPEVARDDWVDLVYTLQDVSEGLNNMTPEELTRITLEGWYGDYLRNLYTNWSSRYEDLESLVGYASRFESLPDLLAQLVLLNSETTNSSVDISEDSLRLTTIHQAKGLEFPVVFVIGLAENLFPLKRAVEEGDVEEERRLFYVAVTRAMDQLYMTQPRISVGNGPPVLLQPSRFISELPEDLYEILKLKSMGGREYY